MTETNVKAFQGVTIRYSKLIEGISTVFAGTLTMLEAVDPGTAKKLVGRFLEEDDDRSKDILPPEEKAESSTPEASKVGNMDNAAVPADASVPGDTDATSEAAGETGQAQETSKPTSVVSITQDDITKIIVQKIKQNRSNNEKIGAILKTYGVAKVSDLPASRYEAFVTDLSAI